MVNTVRDRQGRGMIGCITPLVLLGLLFFLGVKFGRPWFAYEQFRDQIESMAGFATTLNDSVMRARISARADSLRLPEAAKKNLKIQRLVKPPRVRIETSYTQTVELPFLEPKVLKFHPVAEDDL